MASSTPLQRLAYRGAPCSAHDAQLPAVFQVVSTGAHNSEVPELYAAHPFRLLSVGRTLVDTSVNLTIGVATWNALPLAKENEGW